MNQFLVASECGVLQYTRLRPSTPQRIEFAGHRSAMEDEMSVYVGAAEWPFGRMMMAHMTADTTAELLAMADAIGVQRKWIQYPGTWKEHFDICKSKRAKAVAHGAIEVDHTGETRLLQAKRASGIMQRERKECTK